MGKKMSKYQKGGSKEKSQDAKNNDVLKHFADTAASQKSGTWYKEGPYKKDYEESSFKDDIDFYKKPYPKDHDMYRPKK